MVTTAVTREPRPGERSGVTHHFLSPTEFEAWKNDGKLLEWAEVYGRQYGTPRREVEEPIDAGEDVVLRVDVQGAKSVKGKLPEAVVIFIAPPSTDELKRRLESRATEDSSEIGHRLDALNSEMAFRDECDYVVVNETDGQKQAARQLGEIIRLVRGNRQRSGVDGGGLESIEG
jgi:guanylate kinase